MVVLAARVCSSLLLLSFFSCVSSAQRNDDDDNIAARARAELSTILGKTSPWRTDFNTYDSYSEFSEDTKEEVNAQQQRSSSDSDSSSLSEDVFTYREWRTKPIDFYLSVSLKLSGFHRDGNFLAKVTKRDI